MGASREQLSRAAQHADIATTGRYVRNRSMPRRRSSNSGRETDVTTLRTVLGQSKATNGERPMKYGAPKRFELLTPDS